MPTRVKICGLTRPEDAILAAEYGADAIGLNFIGGPRKVTGDQAAAILDVTPTLITTIALLFLDENANDGYSDALKKINNDILFNGVHFRILQLYGLTPQFVEHYNAILGRSSAIRKPDFWIPMNVAERNTLKDLRNKLDTLHIMPGALLLDTASKSGQLGGTGQPFNWNWIAEARNAGELDNLPPIILAGGLTPDNVAEAIRITKPYAVDVSSGVEPPNQPGIKDPIKMRDFIQAAKSAP